MVHPSDGEAWKHFNSVHPHFSAESRNVHLGLCTDGFNPFRSFAAPYSCWSIILTVYNLPPEMCIRPEFMFLSTVIPGPSSPGRNIDVCLRLDWWVGAVVVLRSFDLWYIEETKFCYEVGFDVDYQWFSSLWNAFWLEYAWETSMFILHGKQQGIHANKWR
jgi:hypothetical protein